MSVASDEDECDDDCACPFCQLSGLIHDLPQETAEDKNKIVEALACCLGYMLGENFEEGALEPSLQHVRDNFADIKEWLEEGPTCQKQMN